MSDVDADAGRNFVGLDAREAQDALAEEFTDDMDKKEDASPAQADPARNWSAEEFAEHKRMAEALLFAAVDPLDEATIAARLPAGADIARILARLAEEYQGGGVTLTKVAESWRFATSPDLAHVLVTERVEQRKLSRAALETLAIIAYHQPCTRADIEDVRGVQVFKGSLDQLLEIGWVRLRDRRRDAPGRPVLYGTTDLFLEHFGLENVGDLPGMADLKAAGLLDARLPPGFTVPSPAGGEDEDFIDEGADDEAEFALDFLEDADDESGRA